MDNTYFIDREPTIRRFPYKIFIDQLGYKPDGSKKAVLTVPSDSFSVKDESGAVRFSGKTVHFGMDECSGDDVYTADFSSFTEEGSYFVEAEDGSRSMLFDIGGDVYGDVLDSTTKAFYYLRCGCELTPEHAGAFTHGKCHNERAVLLEKPDVSLDVSGGWHDAGDYGRYVTAAACAVAHLLYAYKMYPKSFEAQSLNIPESGNGVPELLSECRYELEWLLKMQSESGGVYHKATTFVHAPFVMPEEDKAQMLVFPISSMATADFAAVCALAHGFYLEYDKAFADTLLNAALRASEWLESNPQFTDFKNPEGCNTGSYREFTDIDNRFWAYCELYNTTGSDKYAHKLRTALDGDFPRAALGYGSIGGLGALSYLLSGRETDPELCRALKAEFVAQAERLAEISDGCGYGAAMKAEHYCWGSIMNLLKHGMTFAIADYLEGCGRFRAYAEAQLHVLLGVNATGFSFVTGAGEFCCSNPHYRPSYADGVDECVPGLVSGGANGHPSDADAKILIPEGTPPMKCYADDVGCYSLNEITIYWNSPAVFLIASVL